MQTLKSIPPKKSIILSLLLQTYHQELSHIHEMLLNNEKDETKEDPNHSHLLLIPLLETYKDVFPQSIPHGLPPKRDLQHKIDFITGAMLPNKPTYRSNPSETEEIRKQVEDLLAKGLIRESLRPCVVPTLLVPKTNGEWRMCVDTKAIKKKSPSNIDSLSHVLITCWMI